MKGKNNDERSGASQSPEAWRHVEKNWGIQVTAPVLQSGRKQAYSGGKMDQSLTCRSASWHLQRRWDANMHARAPHQMGQDPSYPVLKARPLGGKAGHHPETSRRKQEIRDSNLDLRHPPPSVSQAAW